MNLICEVCKKQITKNKRTIQQNKYFHKILSIIADHTENYTAHELKILFKHHYGMYDEILNRKTGEVLFDYHSTAELSRKEFAKLTEYIINFANFHGVNILTPEEYYES